MTKGLLEGTLYLNHYVLGSIFLRKSQTLPRYMTLHTIELDASSWKTAQDFRLALKAAIGAPEWHGEIVAAFLDSIFGGGMNTLKPAYVIKVVNTASLVPEVKEMVHDFSSAIAETRARRLARIGEDVAVRLEIEN